MVAYDKPIGLLINFGSTSLQFKKVFNPKYRQSQDLSDAGIDRISSIQKSSKSQNPEHPDSDNKWRKS